MKSQLKTKLTKKSSVINTPYQLFKNNNSEDFVLKNIIKDFGFVWSIFILICNFFLFLISFYFIGSLYYPTDLCLSILILLELLTMTDILIQFILKILKIKPAFFIHLKFYSLNDKIYTFANILSAFPQIILFTSLNNYDIIDLDDQFFGNLIAFKLLRILNIIKFSHSLKEMLIFMNIQAMIFLKFLENFLIIMISIHIAACCFMVLDRDYDKEGFFDLHDYESRNEVIKYLNCILWSVYALSGCSFNDIYAENNAELIFCLILLILGGILFGKIFGDFEKAMHMNNKEIDEKKNNFSLCKAFTIDRELPSNIRKKIRNYFNNEEIYYSHIYQDIYSKFPTSLKTEIILNCNKDLIRKVSLFNLGSPFFVFSAFKGLSIKITLKNEIIIRKNEVFKEFYIIKRGKVEILTEENHILAILEEGAFFGEIAYFFTNKCTATVRALTDCVFLVLSKDKLDKLLLSFPDEKAYLMKVAGQRKKTCSKKDLRNNKRNDVKNQTVYLNSLTNIDSKNYQRHSSIPLSLLKRNRSAFEMEIILKGSSVLNELESKSIDITNMEKNNDSLITNSSLDISKAFEADITDDYIIFKTVKNYIIMPFSKFYYLWFYILIIVYIYNLFYTSFALFFVYKLQEPFIIIDILAIIIYFMDIYVNCFTSYIRENDYCNSPSILIKNYISNGFIMDLIEFLPIDYALSYLSYSDLGAALRLLRLLKILRINKIFNLIRKNSSKSYKYSRTINLIFVQIIVLHWSACIMYSISKYEYKKGDQNHNIFKYVDHIYKNDNNDFELSKKSLFEIYIFFLYWSSECTGPPNEDVSAVSTYEKMFQLFMILFYKIYISFLAAEFVQLLSIQKANYLNYINQLHMINDWVKHKQFPLKLQKKIINYHNCIWRVFKGTKDYDVLAILPETLKEEILLNMLNEYNIKIKNICILLRFFSKIKFLPKENPEILLSITKKLKIFAIPKGEFLCKYGEINTEIFFILEGYAAVLSPPNYNIKDILKSGDYHGEQEMNEGAYETHKNFLKAITDLTVAQLSYKDLISISNEYSILKNCFENTMGIKNPEIYLSDGEILNNSIFSSLSQIEEEKEIDYSDISFESNQISFDITIDKINEIKEFNDINDDIEIFNLFTTKNNESNNDVNDSEFNNISNSNEFNKDFAIIEDSSVELNFTENSEIKDIIKEKNLQKNKFSNFINFCDKNLKAKGMKILITFSIGIFNFIYVPLNMIFHNFNYSTEVIIIEVFSILYLSIKFKNKFLKYYKTFKNNHFLLLSEKNINETKITKDIENAFILKTKSKWKLILGLIYDFLYIIPFPLMFTKVGWFGTFYFLNFIRLTNVRPLMNSKNKKNILSL